MLSKDNELPSTTYKVKQCIYPLGLEVQKIHACPNDCSSTDVMSTRIWMHAPYAVHCVTRSEKMIMRISRGSVQRREFLPRSRGTRNTTFKRLFRNKENAKLLRWHKEEHKQDSMSRHLADGSQWRKIDRTYTTLHRMRKI